jgi:hypothetical protein
VLTPLIVADAWPTSHPVLFSKEIGLFDRLLEEDALQIIEEINSSHSTWSRFGHFTDGTKLEQTSFRSICVVLSEERGKFRYSCFSSGILFRLRKLPQMSLILFLWSLIPLIF